MPLQIQGRDFGLFRCLSIYFSISLPLSKLLNYNNSRYMFALSYLPVMFLHLSLRSLGLRVGSNLSQLSKIFLQGIFTFASFEYFFTPFCSNSSITNKSMTTRSKAKAIHKTMCECENIRKHNVSFIQISKKFIHLKIHSY